MIFFPLHGNWVDLLIILVIILYLLSGWTRGFLLGFLDFGGFIFSFFLALKFYPQAGDFLVANFSLPLGIARALGFLLTGFFLELIFFQLINYFFRFLSSRVFPKLSRFPLSLFFFLDKFFGFVPVLGEALILLAFLLTLLVALPIRGSVKQDVMASKIGKALVVRTQSIEKELKSIFGQAVNETLTFITINPNLSFSDRLELGFTQKEVKVDEGAESLMFSLVNEERAKRGLRKLSFSLTLRDLARDYGKDMFARGYFSHYNPEGESPFERMEKRGIVYMAAGENLAMAPDVFLAHQGLMNSEGHRKNILSADFGKVGIGVIDGGIYGKIFVQEFTD